MSTSTQIYLLGLRDVHNFPWKDNLYIQTRLSSENYPLVLAAIHSCDRVLVTEAIFITSLLAIYKESNSKKNTEDRVQNEYGSINQTEIYRITMKWMV